ISTTPRATPNGAPASHCFSAPASAVQRLLQTDWTATGDSPTAIDIPHSLLFLLSGELEKRLLCLADIIQSERARFNQVGHDSPARAAEQPKQAVDEPALGPIPRDRRFEDVRRSDLLHAAQRFFDFEPVDHCLHGGIRRPLLCRKELLNFPNGTRPPVP